jgi:hypothetical protein
MNQGLTHRAAICLSFLHVTLMVNGKSMEPTSTIVENDIHVYTFNALDTSILHFGVMRLGASLSF